MSKYSDSLIMSYGNTARIKKLTKEIKDIESFKIKELQASKNISRVLKGEVRRSMLR